VLWLWYGSHVRQVGVIVGIGLIAVFLTGCGGSESSAPPPLTAQQKLNLGVVAIDARVGGDRVRSSGTVIDGDAGLVLTAAHSVWGATSLRVTTGLGVLHGRIVGRAPCDDLALVEVEPRVPGLVALPQASGGEPPTADLLTAVGRREADPELGTGSLVRIPTRAARAGVDASLGGGLQPLAGAILLDAPLVPESSGGPVVDREGRLVGLAMATEEGAGRDAALAVPWSVVKTRLDELERGPRRIYVGWRDQYRCAPQLHAYAAAEHPGYRRVDARIDAPVPATRLPGTQTLDE
jgi:S1-C subfamily serine protease